MNDAQERLQPVLETLVRLTTELGCAVTGFVFGAEPPIFIHFSNVNEAANPEELVELHIKLLEVYVDRFEERERKEL